jgi:hypothetical protein
VPTIFQDIVAEWWARCALPTLQIVAISLVGQITKILSSHSRKNILLPPQAKSPA